MQRKKGRDREGEAEEEGDLRAENRDVSYSQAMWEDFIMKTTDHQSYLGL